MEISKFGANKYPLSNQQILKIKNPKGQNDSITKYVSDILTFFSELFQDPKYLFV